MLILKNGEKVADGTMAEVRTRFAGDTALSLEDVFFRATGDTESAGPPPLLP